VLAPPWADPSIYPAGAVLDRNVRLQSIIDTLSGLAGSSDVICLQEITDPEFDVIQAALPEFDGFRSYHDPSYWSQYITEDPPWERNGNAILLKRAAFDSSVRFSDQPLSDSGNHAPYAEATHTATGKRFRILSVHFDTDTGANRKREMTAVMTLLSPRTGSVDLIVGDFNSSPEQGNYSDRFRKAGFVDVLAAVGNGELTSPYAEAYANSANFGVIDHVTVRNAVPTGGDVLDNHLFEVYPDVPGGTYEEARIKANLEITGSDHFPLWGTMAC
jgi:endonuclease/exonuclease/phosphatase family metal-dependent hydrolase